MKHLIISPHIDDEILGCFSVLDKDTFVLYCGVEDRSYVSKEERVKELELVREHTHFKYKILGNLVNSYKAQDLISAFEQTINEHKPEFVFIPYPSYNQDHRAVYSAALVALRPHDTNHFVKKVL